MASYLTVMKELDEKFKCEDISFMLEIVPVVVAQKYPTYSSVSWKVNPDNSKEAYLHKLVEFYRTLEAGNLTAAPNKEPFLLLTHAGDPNRGFVDYKDSNQAELPFADFQGDDPSVLSHPYFKDFVLLRAYTPFANLLMESYIGPWSPAKGRLSVLSHNNLSKPLAKLISKTAKIPKLPVQELEQLLAANVYNF